MHLISQIYFWNNTLHVSDSSSVHYQEFFAVHTAMVYVIQVCWQLASRIRTPDDGQRNCPKHVECYSKNKFEKRPDPARKLSANLYDIYHCCVYCGNLLMMDRGTVRNMWCYSKNKFEKLVHLVGFIIRIYYDARSHERQIRNPTFTYIPSYNVHRQGPNNNRSSA